MKQLRIYSLVSCGRTVGSHIRSAIMAAKRLAQTAVDWHKLGSTIPKAAVSEFNAFRTKHETIKGSLASLAAKPTPVDWSAYLSSVKNKALVEKFQAAYSKVQVPYPADTESAVIDAEEKQVETDVVEMIKLKREKITSLTQEIAKIKAQKPFEEMTTDEYMDAHPELKKQVDAEIQEIGWR